MKKISLALFFLFITSTQAKFVSIIDSDHNNYSVVDDLNTEYGEWIEVSNVCSNDFESSEFYYDTVFEQTTTCLTTEERSVVKSKTVDGITSVISTTTETNVSSEATIQNITGTHLEKSCNDIITNNYANDDGVYFVGESDDNFQVYCDMRDNEGWTLIAKINNANIDSIDEPQDWFVNGQNTDDILNPNLVVNNGFASLGLTNLNKLDFTNTVSEFVFINDIQTKSALFYKDTNITNIQNWFNGTEATSTTVCTDKDLTQNCVASQFQNVDNVYFLKGMSLSVHGYTAPGDLHLRHNENVNAHISSICSYTFSYDNNEWGDTYNTHWGNGALIYIR